MSNNKIIENIEALVEISSKTSNYDGINKVAWKLRELYSDLPLAWEERSVEDKPTFLIARTEVNDSLLPIVTLSGHMDVVYPVEDTNIKMENRRLYGAGVNDMKAGLIILFESLRELNKKSKLKNIIVSLSPEEEIATPNYRHVIEEIAKESDYVMVFESTLDYEPEAPLRNRSFVSTRRGFRHYKVLIKTEGGHSGLIMEKEKRKSSNLLAGEFICELEKLADYKLQTTINTGLIKGGVSVNSISPICEIEFETRFSLREEMDRIHTDIINLINRFKAFDGFEIEFIEKNMYPPLYQSEKVSSFIKILEDTAKETNINLIKEHRGGGSEASLFYYYNPEAAILDGFGPRGHHEHTPNEYIEIDSIEPAIEFTTGVISKLLG